MVSTVAVLFFSTFIASIIYLMRFSDIPGQKLIKERLKRTVIEQRVSHAQLFLGPPGSGKLPMALAYAQYINCHNRTADDSCGVCPSCLQYGKLAHPDLHFLYPIATTKEFDSKPLSTMFLPHWRKIVPESKGFFSLNDWYEQIGIENKQGLINTEDCNELIRKLSYTSYESEYKVMIIWMVEKIHHTGANKILKILEEPPDKTLFLLIAEHHELMLPTILSRTQLVKFPKYTDEEIEQGLVMLSGCTATDAHNAKLAADGNMTEGLKIVGEGNSNEEHFILFRDWMRVCYKRDVQSMVKMAAEFNSGGRENMKRFLLYSLRVTRYCALNNLGLSDYVNSDGEEMSFINAFTPYINPKNVHLFAEEFNDSVYHIERNANGLILFLDLSLKAMFWLRM